MPLETPINYIPDLNPANPASADNMVQGDDHLRGIKTALRNTFPNFTDTPLQSSQADVDAACHTGILSIAGINFGKAAGGDATIGFNSTAAGKIQVSGHLYGNGMLPSGAIVDFPKAPATLGTEWLELDGSLQSVVTFPDLAAFLGTTFGGDGTTTFGLPNCKDTGRFRRSRTGVVPAGTYQSNALKSHSHTGTTGTAGSHTHAATVTDPQHSHSLPDNMGPHSSGGGSAFNALTQGVGSGYTTNAASTGISVSIAAAGDHTHTFTTDATGDTETRPEAFVVVSCIKT